MQTHNWKCHPKKRHFGDGQQKAEYSKDYILQWGKTKVEHKFLSHGHPLRKHLSTGTETSLSCHGAPERCLQAFINTILFWPSPLHSLNVCGETWRKRLLAAWNAGPVHAVRAKCCCLFHMEINAAECSQLPNKWLWLLLLHTKQWKKQGALAVAWEQKEGINGERNKTLVWLELRNTQHDFWYVP